MATIAGLTVRLVADTQQWVRETNRAAAQSRRLERALQDATEPLKTMQTWGRRASLALAGLTATITLGVTRAAQYADQFEVVANQTGLTRETIQELAFAAEQSDADLQQLSVGLRGFVRRAAEAAAGNEQFLKGFEQLGLTQDDVREGLSDIEELLLDVAERTSQLESTAEQSAVAMTLMSDAGRQLVPLLARGREGIEELMQQARDLGIVIDEQSVAALAAFQGELDILRARTAATSAAFFAQFVPAAQVVVEWINRGITAFQSLDDEQRRNIARWIAIGGVILAAVGILGALAGALRAIILTFRLVGLASLVSFAAPILTNIAIVGGIFLALREAWEADLLGLRTLIENTELGQAIQRAFDEASVGEIALAGVILSLVGAKLWLVGRALARWIGNLIFGTLGGAFVPLAVIAALAITGTSPETRQRLIDDLNRIIASEDPITVKIAEAIAAVQQFLVDWGEQSPLSRLAAELAAFFLVSRVFGPGVLALTVGIRLGFKIQDLIFENLFGPGMDEMVRQADDIETLTRDLFTGAEVFSFQTGRDFTSSVEAFGEYLDRVSEASEETANLRDEILATAEALNLFGGPQRTILDIVGEPSFRAAANPQAQELIERLEENEEAARELRDALSDAPLHRFVEFLRGLIGFQSGGFTGSGPVDEVAGVVHRGEIVIPARAVRKGLPGILDFLGIHGFQEGAGEGFFSGLTSFVIEQLRSEQARRILGEELVERAIGIIERFGGTLATIESEAKRAFEAIGNFGAEIDEMIDQMERERKAAEERIRQEQQQAAMLSLVNAALGNFPVVMSAVQDAAMGAALGPVGMLMGAFLGLAQHSEVASQAFAIINELLGTLMQALAPLFQPLLIIARILGIVLAPVLQVFGVILEALVIPVLRILFPILKFLAQVILAGVRVIGQAWNAIADIVHTLTFGLVRIAKVNIPALDAAMEELAGLTWEQATAVEKSTDAVNAFTSSIQNAPRAFRVQTHRLAAQTPIPVMDTGGVVQGPGVFAVGAGVREIVRDPEGAGGDTINVTIVSNDPQVIWRKLQPLIQRDRARIAGSRFAVPGPASTG